MLRCDLTMAYKLTKEKARQFRRSLRPLWVRDDEPDELAQLEAEISAHLHGTVCC